MKANYKAINPLPSLGNLSKVQQQDRKLQLGRYVTLCFLSKSIKSLGPLLTIGEGRSLNDFRFLSYSVHLYFFVSAFVCAKYINNYEVHNLVNTILAQ